MFELRERIYSRFEDKMVPAPAAPMFDLNGILEDGYPKMAVTKHPHLYAWRVEVYDPDTNAVLMNFYAYTKHRYYGYNAPDDNAPDEEHALWIVSTN